MNSSDPPEHQVRRSAGRPSNSERASRQRLREVLGVNAAGVEVILHLRHQVIALQTRVHQLEAQLEAQLAVREAGQNTRLTRHREQCLEASWQEVIATEERP